MCYKYRREKYSSCRTRLNECLCVRCRYWALTLRQRGAYLQNRFRYIEETTDPQQHPPLLDMGDHTTTTYYGQRFYPRQHLAVDGHALPGHLVKWKENRFMFFDTREDMVDWFQRDRGACLSTEQPSMPLEVVYEGQRR